MPENITREIAFLVSVVSIALLGITFVLISLSWRGFEQRFVSLSRDERKELFKTCSIYFIPILVLVSVVTCVGIYSPDLVQASAFLTMLGIGAIAVLYLLVYGIRRLVYFVLGKKNPLTRTKLDESVILYFMSLVFLALSIFFTVFALIGIAPNALEIKISASLAEDFNWARWMLLDGIMFFTFGLFATGISYLTDRSRYWRRDKSQMRMKKPQTNYAFIDGTNLHLTMVNLGWHLDYQRFRVYLSEHYSVDKAYYFVGYVPEMNDVYISLQSYGFVLVHKPVLKLKDGTVKGNVDAELVLQVMVDYDNYQKAVVVTSDGDFYCLVHYLRRMDKLECVLAPCRAGCSHLLKKGAGSRIAFMDNLRGKLEYKKKRTP